MKNPRRVFYDRSIGSYISADLREWGGRWHYFTGRYYDQENRLLVQKFLKAGDTYIDIGANVGVQTLAAARVVGPSGVVVAAEPNPTTFSTLRAHVVLNGFTNVQLFNVGLSDKPATLTLANDSNHPGTFTFRSISNAVASVDVPVVVGDELLAGVQRNPKARTLVKIDTEGHEHHVLRGLKGLIATENVAFIVEVTDEWLRAAGSSAEQLYGEMKGQGYQAFSPSVHYPMLRPAVRLREMTEVPTGQHDVFFARRSYF
jgi:FkbM family methyltransferase